jgi:hypothetical protein
MSKKRRKIGAIFLDLEKILLELVDHGMQWGDILFQVYGYLMVHAPGAREEYKDGTNPELTYGPRKESHE